MAAPRHALSHSEWCERATQRAIDTHLDGTARYLKTLRLIGGAQVRTYLVPSIDRSGEHYVTYDTRTTGVVCNCTAGTYGNACAHAGAVLHAEAQRTACEADEARDNARSGGNPWRYWEEDYDAD